MAAQHTQKHISIKYNKCLTISLPFLLFIPGYAFLLFQEETSVQALIDACIEEDGKLYLCVSSPTIKDKPVSDKHPVKSLVRSV